MGTKELSTSVLHHIRLLIVLKQYGTCLHMLHDQLGQTNQQDSSYISPCTGLIKGSRQPNPQVTLSIGLKHIVI